MFSSSFCLALYHVIGHCHDANSLCHTFVRTSAVCSPWWLHSGVISHKMIANCEFHSSKFVKFIIIILYSIYLLCILVCYAIPVALIEFQFVHFSVIFLVFSVKSNEHVQVSFFCYEGNYRYPIYIYLYIYKYHIWSFSKYTISIKRYVYFQKIGIFCLFLIHLH